jgi:ADP-ribosylglycohydrolase
LQNKDHILGALYGQAIGDAMGMPTELWPVETIRAYFGQPITTFLDGPQSNAVACNFTKGEYTDDTNQALAILDALIETHWQPNQKVLVHHIMAWANQVDAWHNNILGPSSKAALLAIKNNEDPSQITAKALTNGAGMRIAPIGTLFSPQQLPTLVNLVCDVTQITHASDVAFGGAALIAGAVCAAVADRSWQEIVTFALKACDLATAKGAPTWAAKVHQRTELGLHLAQQYAHDTPAFSQAIYDLIGTGTMVSESIPAALAIAYYTANPHDCALLCANLGGDTDTIGAMATAICGAKNGYHSIDPDWIHTIDTKNPQHQLRQYAAAIQAAKLD